MNKKYSLFVLLLGIVLLILAVYMTNSSASTFFAELDPLSLAAKQHFICSGSKCRIAYLDKRNKIISKPEIINRNTIGNIEVRHSDTAVTNRSVIMGRRKHRYYLRFLPQNMDRANYEDYYLNRNQIELGPVSNEKYANEILEQLKKSIPTENDIDIEIKLGSSRSW